MPALSPIVYIVPASSPTVRGKVYTLPAHGRGFSPGTAMIVGLCHELVAVLFIPSYLKPLKGV